MVFNYIDEQQIKIGINLLFIGLLLGFVVSSFLSIKQIIAFTNGHFNSKTKLHHILSECFFGTILLTSFASMIGFILGFSYPYLIILFQFIINLINNVYMPLCLIGLTFIIGTSIYLYTFGYLIDKLKNTTDDNLGIVSSYNLVEKEKNINSFYNKKSNDVQITTVDFVINESNITNTNTNKNIPTNYKVNFFGITFFESKKKIDKY
jgi:hypothetical protein